MRPLKYIACGLIGFAIPFVVTFLFSGCLLKDAVGLDRSRTTDNRTTNITINEAQGEAFYRDGDGWTWVLDKFCTVIDGPFDLTGDKDPQATKPTAPNPPPPCEGQTIIPDADEAGMPFVLMLLLLPAMLSLSTGCAIGSGATASFNPHISGSIPLSVYNRGGTNTSQAAMGDENMQDGKGENLQDGGGAVSASREGNAQAGGVEQ